MIGLCDRGTLPRTRIPESVLGVKIPDGAFVGVGGEAIEALVRAFVGAGEKRFCVASDVRSMQRNEYKIYTRDTL